MDLFIAWDGDHIGRKVGQLALDDDEEGLRRVSQTIDSGNRLMASWVQQKRGAMISYGGDEGRARVPADALTELDRIRAQYAQCVGSPVSVGVGIRLSESDKALLSAKLRGGDQIVLYGPQVDEDLKQMQEKDEGQKISDEYLKKTEKLGQAAFRHKTNGNIIPSGIVHDLDSLPGGENSIDAYEPGFISKDGRFYTHDQARDWVANLQKDDESAGPPQKLDPTNNASAGGGYTPRHEAGAGGAPEAPMQEASEHSQGEAMQSMADNTSSPEGSGTTADFEQELHDHAQDQDGKDKDAADQKDQRADARQKVLQILGQVRQAAPQLEQLRDQAPDLYGVLMQMTQALIITSRGLLDDQQQPDQDSQDAVEQKGEESSPNGDSSPPSEPAQKSEPAYKLEGDALIEVDPKTGKSLGKGPLNKSASIEAFDRESIKGKVGEISREKAKSDLDKPHFVLKVDDKLIASSIDAATLLILAKQWSVKAVKFIDMIDAEDQQVSTDSAPRIPGGVSFIVKLEKAEYKFKGGEAKASHGTYHVAPAPAPAHAPAEDKGHDWHSVHYTPNSGGKSHVVTVHSKDKAKRVVADHHREHLMQKADWKPPAIAPVSPANPTSTMNAPKPPAIAPVTPAAPVGLKPPPAPVKEAAPAIAPAPALHSDLKGFLGGLKQLPEGSPARGKFITQHLNHPPIVAALQSTPQGKQLHSKLSNQFLDGRGNAGFKAGSTVATAKNDEFEKMQSHVELPVGAEKDGKIKVRHEDDHTGWVSVRAGQVLSNDGHPVSSRNPGGR